ncbi:hypothetical protein GOP47_0017600 [Adiantum capillus-veneris]|uniref:VASt domain-containing protein n=1 Tax=Adiantum capillus-veneris TaxID=13818 RepID=A0A9D4ZAR1_ADICA|nr:hypothetical protein GOP47_0017600 [Adiantum capillus-veneris]
MKLLVQLLEARNLKSSDRPWQAYAQLKLGNRAVLNIIIWGQDRLSNVFLGRLRLSIADILKAERQVLPSSWYPLERRHSKSKTPISGEVRVSFSLSLGELSSSPRYSSARQLSDTGSPSSLTSTLERSPFHSGLAHSSCAEDQSDETSKEHSSSSSAYLLHVFVAWLSSIIVWLLPKVLVAWLSSHVPWCLPLAKNDAVETAEEAREDAFIEDEGIIFPAFFDDDGVCVPSSVEEIPPPLKGVLLSGTYMMSAKAMNGILFGPGCQFLKDLTAMQKTTNVVEGHWTRGENDLPRRVVTYLKAATKLIPSVKATEEQVYSRADDKGFVVDVSASTPDVPYGSTFKVNVQYCIFSGSQTKTGEKTCFLRISWGVHFLTSSMMKGFIEKGARQGLQESYKQFAQLLEKYARPQQESLTTESKACNLESQEGAGDVPVSTSQNPNFGIGKISALCGAVERLSSDINEGGNDCMMCRNKKFEGPGRMGQWQVTLMDGVRKLSQLLVLASKKSCY